MRQIIITLLLAYTTVCATAQSKFDQYDKYTNYYSVIVKDGKVESIGQKFMIYRDKMAFLFDSDSASDANMHMKNYKKNGNTETFDLYPEANPGTKLCSVKLIITNEKKTIIIGSPMNINTEVKTDKELGLNNHHTTGRGVNPATNTKEKITGGAKKLLDKGKGLFKKNKKEE